MSAPILVPVMVAAVSLAALAGCGQKPLPPPPPPPPKPAGLWTPADTQAVAKELSDSALHQQWVIAFHTHNQREPKVAIKGFEAHATPGGDAAAANLVAVVNDDLQADAGALASQITDNLSASGQVEIAADPAAADFVIAGVLSRELIAGGARYPVDLRLTSSGGETVWTGGLEHTVIAPSPEAEAPAPAPAEAPAGK